jgi:integrase
MLAPKKLSKGVDSTRRARGYSCFYVSLDRKKQYFPTEEERDAFYDAHVATNLLNGAIDPGVAPRHLVQARDHYELGIIKQMIPADVILSPTELVRLALTIVPKASATAEEARADFLAEKKRAVEARSLKQCTLDQLTYATDALLRCGKFATMASVRNPAFKSWFDGRPLSPKGRHSAAKALGVFLNWAVKKRLLVENPLKDMEIPEPPAKRAVFTVAEVRNLMKIAQEEFPDLLVLQAVMWFAGVRPETAERLDFADFDRREKVIRLRVGKFNQGEVEFVERIPEAVWRWLPKTKAGAIIQANHKHRLTAFHRRLGYSEARPWPQDVARHTFASHFAAQSGSLDAVAFALNHKRNSTTLKFYRQRVRKQDGVSYFKILPKK